MAVNLSVAHASAVDGELIRDCLNAAFSDYLIRMPALDSEGWRVFLHRQGVDLELSRVAIEGGRVTSFALVCPRADDRWRIAVMGSRPEARGTDTAPRLLDETIKDARSRGIRFVELEVFAQNERAFRLYRSRGLESACELKGFEAPAGSPARVGDAKSVSLETARQRARDIERSSNAPLPWQVCGEAISRLSGLVYGWQTGTGQLVFTEVPGLIVVQSLLDADARYADAASLLLTLRASFPEAVLRAPQLQVASLAGRAFEAAGWFASPLYQHLMVLKA